MYHLSYLIVEQRHLALVNSYRQTFQKRHEVFRVLLVGRGCPQGNCIHEKGLTKDKTDPHLVAKVDEKKRIALDCDKRVAVHESGEHIDAPELTEMAT